MTRYLLAAWPFAGHLYPMLALAHALRARGHAVGIYSGGAVRTVVEGEGFDFFPFVHVAARLQEAVDGVPNGLAGQDDDTFYMRLIAKYGDAYEHRGLRRARMLVKMSREWILGTAPEQVADVEAVVDRWQPHALVCDPTLWGPYLVVGEARGLPVAICSVFAGCLVPGPDAPPAGFGLPRPRGRAGRVMARATSVAVDIVTAGVRRDASSMRMGYSLPPLQGSVAALSGRVPLHLVTTAPELDLDRHDLPPTVQYVGPCIWDKPRTDPPAAWLEELSRDQPVIYVSEGTAQVAPSALLPAAARGLAGLTMQVIMTTGRHRNPGLIGVTDAMPNIRIERFVPHSDLFPRLSAVVTNGGSGTVRAALAAGVPLVIVPRAWDQFDNAQRVVEAGAGIRLSATRCTPQRIRSAVQCILDEPSYRRNAQRMGTALLRCGGPARAAVLLEELVGYPAAALAGAQAGER